jgi:hypothetical protein
MDEQTQKRCACGQPIRSDVYRCADCVHKRALSMARRRNLAKRVPPEQLDEALAALEARLEAIEQGRANRRALYEAHEARRQTSKAG